MTFISYAQNGEDVILWRALKHIENGFYIDVGACDPEELSVTKAFYERGWSGVNIEPVREYHELCVKNRPRDKNINVAVTARSGLCRFMTVKGTGLSTTIDAFATEASDRGWDVEAQDMLALSLGDICSTLSIRDVHFLKIDVEGGERAVLEGADFEQVRPWIVLVEATEPLSTERSEHLWEHILLQAGYQRAFFDGVNLYYVAQEHSELIAALAAPPNALDDYKTVRMAEAEERIAQLGAALEARGRDVAEGQNERQAVEAVLEDLRQQYAAFTAAHEKTLAQRDLTIGDLRSEHAHQASSAAQRLAFTTRKLAQSRRSILELEERVHAQQHSLDAVTALVGPDPRTNQPAVDLATVLKVRLDDHAERLEDLEARQRRLAAENAHVTKHRDDLLLSTSWRLSAPLRKAKTALQIARAKPHLVLPLVVANLRRRPPNGPATLTATATMPERPSLSHEGQFSGSPREAHEEQSHPHETGLDRQDDLVRSIRHGIGRRRLSNH
jgi:FkbM family methyltransferase